METARSGNTGTMVNKNCKNSVHRFNHNNGLKSWIVQIKDHLDGYNGNGETWLRLSNGEGFSDYYGKPVCMVSTNEGGKNDQVGCSILLWRNGAEELCSQLAKLLGWYIHKPKSEEYSMRSEDLARAVLSNPGDQAATDAYLEHLTSDWFEGEENES